MNQFRWWIQGFYLLLLLQSCESVVGPNTVQGRGDLSNNTVQLQVGKTFPRVEMPTDNPLTDAGIKLGRMLFYDPILSGDSTMSCSSCHLQKYAFGENKRFSTGIDMVKGDRNSMPLINSAWTIKFFWDGRAKSLEDQALGPLNNPIEMHLPWNKAEHRIRSTKRYPPLFKNAFGTSKVDSKRIAKALAQFERTLISDQSKYDRVLRGEDTLTASELHGLNMFFSEKADCFHCHGNILFTDALFHNTGLEMNYMDKGKELVSHRKRDEGKFKTPTLRNLAFTAPYMHDGRFKTLEEVIDFYSERVQNSPNIDPLMKNAHRGGVHLTPSEKNDLIAFLLTLTDSSFIHKSDYSNPYETK